MSRKYLVAIVGRPNVGKSSFFNKICGRRISIVKDVPGVTRDRIYADAEWCGHNFTLIDTGGIELKSQDTMFKHIREQAEVAIDVADVILFFVDGKDGLLASDFDIADILRLSKKPVLLVVNKLDNNNIEDTYDFYQLGLGEPHAISCEQSLGLGDLLDEVVACFPQKNEEEEDLGLKIALVGRPNVGKSSLVNKILGFKRVIVSDVEGTTRDAIDTPFTYNDTKYTIIDTAGMRRKRGIEDESVEDYSVMRTISAIDRADVVISVIDASEEISEQDIRIIGYVHEQGKPGFILINKWDKIEKDTYTADNYLKEIKKKLDFMDYAQFIFVSALTGLRTDRILPLVDTVFLNASQKISTGVLNEVIGEAVAAVEPPTSSGRRLKVQFITQTGNNPPTFTIFVNNAALMHFSYERYLENCMRRAFDFSGTPIKLIFKSKQEKK
ncbi:MAG: ribosome biogenesis GTPase Der [Clostridia bacterium]|nr:ribosome biogenesis GTPase Der [Clostridia bacterium]